MNNHRSNRSTMVLLALALALGLVGCTVHPTGEREERAAARGAGQPFIKPPESRRLPVLAESPAPDELVQYALLASASLEQRYWEWRTAIEQIPQDGSQTSTLNFAAGTTFTRGQTGPGSSTIALANDPMTDIKWPGKLDAAAKAALENARAAGRRFRKAQFELRAGVLDKYYDYAINAELIRLEQSNQQLLQTMVSVAQAQNRAGSAGQQDVLKAQNELDLSANDIAAMQSQLPAQRAAINAILGRAPEAPIAPPAQLPPAGVLEFSDAQLIAIAARQNPELGAQADEIRGRQQGVELAKLQYYPDFNLSAGTDLMGISQSLLGQATIPVFRYEALNAAIAQAEANLKASQAMRRQTASDLGAQLVMDERSYRDAGRQLALLEETILPRARRSTDLLRSAYESNHATLFELLDSRRSVIAIQRLAANLRITQARRLAEIEAIIGAPLHEQDI